MKTKEYYEREIKKIDDLREKLGDNITMKKSCELAKQRANIYKNLWRFNKRIKKVK